MSDNKIQRNKNVTDPYYYVNRFDRIMYKLWKRQNKTENALKFQRYLKSAQNAHKALMQYVYPGLHGYKMRSNINYAGEDKVIENTDRKEILP